MILMSIRKSAPKSTNTTNWQHYWTKLKRAIGNLRVDESTVWIVENKYFLINAYSREYIIWLIPGVNFYTHTVQYIRASIGLVFYQQLLSLIMEYNFSKQFNFYSST